MNQTYSAGYRTNYSDDGFWASVGKYAKKLGAEVIHKAICLWIVIQKSNAPIWAKSVAMAALGYLISPVDVVPDVLPGGLIDDIGVIGAAFATLTIYITDEIKRQAWGMLPDWFR
jgi:uncharacterized membrane protein YkvA (DUF1232 family)